MKKPAWLLLLVVTVAYGQTQKADDEAIFAATTAAWNLDNGIAQHLAQDGPNFHPTKQQPEDNNASLPSLLLRKDGTAFDPATPGQQARELMEELRQGIHALQSAEKAEALDAMALDQGRASWLKMRDIFCRQYPDVRYYDLDGAERYCPAKSASSH